MTDLKTKGDETTLSLSMRCTVAKKGMTIEYSNLKLAVTVLVSRAYNFISSTYIILSLEHFKLKDEIPVMRKIHVKCFNN